MILDVARVTKKHHARDFGLYAHGETLDGVVDQGAALAVAADDEGRRRAFGGRHGEELGAGRDGGVVGVFGQEVGREQGWVAVFGAYALAGDLVGPQLLLERGAGGWTGNRTLWTTFL